MIDLKNEIEKLIESASEFYCKTANINSRMCLQGQVEAYQDCLDVINNYNIITAPKTIKLSEIVDKICDTNYKSECWVEPIKLGKGNYKIRTQYGDAYWCVYDFYIEDKKIVMYQDDYLLPFDEFKWLYALWIAGTIIEDDLKERD